MMKTEVADTPISVVMTVLFGNSVGVVKSKHENDKKEESSWQKQPRLGFASRLMITLA